MEEEGFGESTWTIDLCYVLQRFRIKFKYTTVTLGVDPGYCKEAFYNKVIAKDYDRVNTRFQEAEARGVEIVETSITLQEILSHLQTGGPVIILTNANLLRCSRCSNYTSCYPSCFSNVSYQVFEIIQLSKIYHKYQGHYILIVGFDPQSREILYRNPTLKDKICYMSYGAFEDARTAYGTDEDVILIYN